MGQEPQKNSGSHDKNIVFLKLLEPFRTIPEIDSHGSDVATNLETIRLANDCGNKEVRADTQPFQRNNELKFFCCSTRGTLGTRKKICSTVLRRQDKQDGGFTSVYHLLSSLTWDRCHPSQEKGCDQSLAGAGSECGNDIAFEGTFKYLWAIAFNPLSVPSTGSHPNKPQFGTLAAAALACRRWTWV